MLQGIEAGELGKWLRVVMANSGAGAHRQDIPPRFADHLVNLRVARFNEQGQLIITDKGRLALRMESPDALHKQVDPDEVVAEPAHDNDADRPAPDQSAGTGRHTLAAYDGEDDDEDDPRRHGGDHDHRR